MPFHHKKVYQEAFVLPQIALVLLSLVLFLNLRYICLFCTSALSFMLLEDYIITRMWSQSVFGFTFWGWVSLEWNSGTLGPVYFSPYLSTIEVFSPAQTSEKSTRGQYIRTRNYICECTLSLFFWGPRSTGTELGVSEGHWLDNVALHAIFITLLLCQELVSYQ